jgi:subtilisin family serine protease
MHSHFNYGNRQVRSCVVRRALIFLTVTSLLVAIFSFSAFAQSSRFLRLDRVQGVGQAGMFVEDEFIVVLKRPVRANVQVGHDASNLPVVNLTSLQRGFERNGVIQFGRQFPGAPTQPVTSRFPDLSGHYQVKLRRGVNLESALADFARDPNVEHVEKIGIHPVYQDPNDPFYMGTPPQWHYWDTYGIDANLAWDKETGKADVVVAVLDTGLRYNHSDLNGNVWVNTGEIPGNGIDDDNNGKVDDVRGYDFVASADPVFLYVCCDADCGTVDNDPSDHNGHGTHVAGTVSAITNNATGVAGVAGGFSNGTAGGAANGVKIMPLRIGWNASLLGQCGYGLVRMDYAAQAMYYVAQQKARGVNIAAVNCSWGSSNSGGIDAAVDNLLANDVMIVHAAGNDNSNTADYLATKTGVMNVAATDINGNGASFTNYGPWVSLAAPGVDIVSTYHLYTDPNTDYYATASGTSMAAPHACGVAALLESLNPSLSGPDKFNIMVSNTKPYIDSRNLGSGILSARKALDAAVGGGNAPPSAQAKSASTNEDVAVPITMSGTDSGQCELTFSIVTGPAHGTLSVIANSNCVPGSPNSDTAMVTYTPSPNYSGPDSFAYKVNDGSADSNIATVSIAVSPINDAPIAADKSATTNKNTPVDITLTATDVDNCELQFIVSGPAHGTLTNLTSVPCSAGTPSSDSFKVTYSPTTNYAGPDSFTYKVNDGTADSNTATVTVTVSDPNASLSHVGDLDRLAASQGNAWKATVTITVHDGSHNLLSNATVTGNWSGGFSGSGSCTTGSNGQCSVASGNIAKKKTNMTFTVGNVSKATLTYQPSANHDPDGDSNGTSIVINKP